MTSVRRPIHLQLRSPSGTSPALGSPMPVSQAVAAAADLLPSQILPHLFVGNQEQTNSETVNRLSISYILSLGLLPLVSSSVAPTANSNSYSKHRHDQEHYHSKHSSPHPHHHDPHIKQQQQQHQQQQISMPYKNSSKDFKIRIRTNAVISPTLTPAATPSPNVSVEPPESLQQQGPSIGTWRESKGVKQALRWIQCKCINIADSSEQMLSKFFDEAHQFIDEARRRKCNILVHCQAGISRSPTIAIAYLMRVNSLPLQDAYNLVKQCRPQTDPNLSFMGQLMIYEKSLESSGCSSAAQVTKQVTAAAQTHQPQQQQVHSDQQHQTKRKPVAQVTKYQ